MKLNKSLAIATLGIAALTLFSSCQDEDFGYTAQQIKNSAYAKNFTQMYGDIDPDQPWDLTSDNLARLGLFGGPSMGSGVTRAGSGPIGTAGDADAIRTFTNVKYEVEERTLAWLNTNLTEEHDHRSLGTSFNLVGPDNDFLIIPIYQGNAGLKWDLHLVAGNGDGTAAGSTDYNIWSKSQNIFYNEDHNKDPYGEEFYFFAKDRGTSYPDGDFLGRTDQQDPEGIYLDKAFPGISKQTEASITFVLPSDMNDLTVNGYFADKDALNTKLSVKIEGEETQDITLTQGSTTTIDLSSLLSNSDLNYLQDLVFKINPKGDGGINGKDNYKNAFMHYTEAAKRIHIYTNYDYTVERDLTEQTNYSTGHTINRTGVKSQAMRINHEKIPGEFIMYLEITYDDGGDYAVQGEKKMSNASPHMMLALTECSIDQQKVNAFAQQLVPDLGKNCQYMILGCEDTNIIDHTASWNQKISSDWDYNDIVFLVVGMPVAPQIKQIYKKRYMIEDLGSTFDFDFNDIVVDVTMEKYVNADGTVDENRTNTYAAIKHLCGTIPFQLKIGETEFNKVTDPTDHEQSIAELRGVTRANGVNWNPDEEDNSGDLARVEITGWNPQENNISIRVWPQDKTSVGANATPDVADDNFAEFTDIPTTDKYGAQGFTFPSNGDFPYIIAVDQTINWMPELKSIPKDWFKTWTPSANQQYNDYNNGQGGGNGGNDGGNSDSNPSDTNHCTEGTSIWTGNMALNWDNQKVEDVYGSINNDDVLHFHFSINNENAKVDIHLGNGWVQVGSGQIALSSLTNKYCVTFKVTDKNKLTQGIVFQGEDCILTGITVVSAPTKPTQGTYNFGESDMNFDLDNWAWHVDMDKSNFTNIENGDVIKVTFAKNGGNASLKDWNEWKDLDGQEKDFNSNPATITLTVNDNNRQKLIDYGMVIQGEGVTFVKAELIQQTTPDNTYTLTTSLASGCEDMGTIEINPQKSAYNTGDVVTVNAKPKPGYKFVSWSDGGAQSHEITIGEENVSITATFDVDPDYVPPTSETIWEGSISGQFQVLAYGGQNTKQNGANKTLIECLESGLTTLVITVDSTKDGGWFQYFGAQKDGTGGWNQLGEATIAGTSVEIDLSTHVETIKIENGIVFQGGYNNITKIEAK